MEFKLNYFNMKSIVWNHSRHQKVVIWHLILI